MLPEYSIYTSGPKIGWVAKNVSQSNLERQKEKWASCPGVAKSAKLSGDMKSRRRVGLYTRSRHVNWDKITFMENIIQHSPSNCMESKAFCKVFDLRRGEHFGERIGHHVGRWAVYEAQRTVLHYPSYEVIVHVCYIMVGMFTQRGQSW